MCIGHMIKGQPQQSPATSVVETFDLSILGVINSHSETRSHTTQVCSKMPIYRFNIFTAIIVTYFTLQDC